MRSSLAIVPVLVALSGFATGVVHAAEDPFTKCAKPGPSGGKKGNAEQDSKVKYAACTDAQLKAGLEAVQQSRTCQEYPRQCIRPRQEITFEIQRRQKAGGTAK